MHLSLGKILSLVIAAGFIVVLALGDAAVDHILLATLCLLLPLALIWFPERLGTPWPRQKSRLGFYVDELSPRPCPAKRDSPPALLQFMGWLFLLGLPALLLWLGTR